MKDKKRGKKACNAGLDMILLNVSRYELDEE